MKMKLTIIILGLLLALALVYAGGYEVPLSRGEADRLYCLQEGVCDLANLTVGSLRIIDGNITFINVTIINYNVTGTMNVDGDITADNYFYQNGQDINSTILWENSTGEARLKSSQNINMQDGDIKIKDLDSEFHDLSRDLQTLDEMSRNITLTGLNGTLDLPSGNVTIKTLSGDNIVVNIDKTETILSSNTDSIIITSGTNESPILTQVIYVDAENPVLDKRTTLGLKSPGVATFLQRDKLTYVSAIGLDTIDNLDEDLFNRFLGMVLHIEVDLISMFQQMP